MASLPSKATILLAVCLMKDVEGEVTVSGSGGTGIPNQQALTLRCNYTVPGDVVTSFTWRRVEGNSAVSIVSGSVTPQTAIFLDSWQNKGVFVGNYTSSLDIQLPASHVTTSYAGTYSCQVSGLSDTGRVDVTASVLDLPSISGLPPVQTVKEFSNLRIDCSTYTTPGNPPTTSYTWTYGGSTVSTGAVLDRSRISRSQGGSYNCTASNTQGSVSASVNVDVQYAPSMSGLPTAQNVTEFSNLRIDCSTYTTPGNPPTTGYTWTFGGSTVSTGAVLDRSSISRNQGGNYTCTASNTLTPSGGSQQQGTAAFQVNVDVQYQASIRKFTANSNYGSVTVNESDPVTLRCQIDSNPGSVIRLLNGTEELTRADNSLTAEYRLESADCGQRGNYSCTATNNIRAPVSQRLELLVKCSPRLDQSQQLKYVSRLGGNVMAIVSVLAYPLPTLTWSRTTNSSHDLTGSSSPVSDISVTARLHLTNLQQQDFGDYSLTVDNGVGGSVAYTVSIMFADPPDQQNPESTGAGVIAGATVGGMLLTLLIGGIVLMVLYRKGYRIRNIQKGKASRKSTTNPDTVELDNRGYSSLDLINSPVQHSHVEEGSEKQQYSQLKIYENTKADATADTSTYEGMAETPPVTYESIRESPYQNTGAHSQGPGHGNK
ncbi:hemicentin-2-like isoform X2 [Haliotis rufescens]|uniref:hemicentin-2-like isoform X2 n=1 Tax=Haliotis rufescens TaxID=6454 RepID=UPI00201ECDA9|nr:hemicentin-2-like isoform X2 [Haliotis rufescens]